MRIYLGCPQRALVNGALADLGDPPPVLVAPKTPVQFSASAYDWHTFLTTVCLLPFSDTYEEPLIFAMACAAEAVLTPNSYFGKARTMPRFHQQLVRQLVQWEFDGLTPDLLQLGAQATADRFNETEADLRAEWLQKTHELVQLWRAWHTEIERRELTNPAQKAWKALETLQTLERLPHARVLLIGFTDFSAFELEVLKALDTRTELAMALLFDPAQPDLFAPTMRLLQRLEQASVNLTCVTLSSETEAVRGGQTFIFSTPNLMTEGEAVAREMIRLHQAGIDYRAMRVLVRHPASVIEYLDTLFTRYNIPYTAEVRQPLLHSRRVLTVLEGLRLLAGSRTGADYLTWLSLPHFQLDACTLRSLHNLRPLSASSDYWLLHAVQHSSNLSRAQAVLQWLMRLHHTLRTNLLETLIQLVTRFADDGSSRSSDLDKLVAIATAHEETLNSMPAQDAVEWLEQLCSGNDFICYYGTDDGVRVMPIEHADLLGGEVVFLMQVLEGVLPRRHPDDPFLREEERLALRTVLTPHAPHLHLPTRADYQAGEPLLFYCACTAAQRFLYLTYPRTQNDSEALPSSYLKHLPNAHTRFFRLEEFVPENPIHPYDRLLQHSLPCEEPSTYLQYAPHRQRVANVNRQFSVTELETLARCPFQHLFRHILRVRPSREGLQLTHVGSAVHYALYRSLSTSRLPDAPYEWAQQMQTILHELLQENPFDLTRWQLQVLEAYATRLLRLFAWRETRYRQQFNLDTIKLEWAFGEVHSNADDEREPLCEPSAPPGPALTYELANNQCLQLCGVIDRIDRSADGKVIMVLDYKLGSVPTKKELLEAQSLQGMLYAHLLAKVRGVEHVVLAYDHLTGGRRVRFLPYERTLIERFRAGQWEGSPRDCVITLTPRELDEAHRRLTNELERLVDMLKNVCIEPLPGSHCRTCAYADLCRRAQR